LSGSSGVCPIATVQTKSKAASKQLRRAAKTERKGDMGLFDDMENRKGKAAMIFSHHFFMWMKWHSGKPYPVYWLFFEDNFDEDTGL